MKGLNLDETYTNAFRYPSSDIKHKQVKKKTSTGRLQQTRAKNFEIEFEWQQYYQGDQ